MYHVGRKMRWMNRTDKDILRRLARGASGCMDKQGSIRDRRHQRVATPKGVWVAWQDGIRQNVSRVRDLNLGGLFIDTPEPPTLGTEINILLSVPEGEIRSKAVVRNVADGKGMGIEFLNISQQDFERLDKLVTRLLNATASQIS